MRQYPCETQADVRAFVRSPSTDVDKETFVRIISEQWSAGSVDRYMTPALAAAHFDAFYELESEKMQAELATARVEQQSADALQAAEVARNESSDAKDVAVARVAELVSHAYARIKYVG